MVAIHDWNGRAGRVKVKFSSGDQRSWKTPADDDMQEDGCSATCENNTSITCGTPNTAAGHHACGGSEGGITCNWIHPGFGLYSVNTPCF